MTVLDAPTRPDVRTRPDTGQDWFELTRDHDLTRQDVAGLYAPWVGADGLVPHAVVVRVTQELCGLEWVCRFFHLVVEDAARYVVGAVLEGYVVDDAIDITGRFCTTWQGCPEASCAG